MSSVTFSTSVGGDGSTVTDDNNATTGLREGGWKTRFVPCFTQQVAVANYVVTKAGEAAASQAAAVQSAIDATNNGAAQVSLAAAQVTLATAQATAAAASYDSFDDRYLGAKTSDPSVDNDGNTLLTGALYWNTTSSVMKIWTGSAWFNPNIASGYLALTGGTMTGAITFNAGQSFAGTLPLAGGTMTGAITFAAGQSFAGTLPLAGGTMTGAITFAAGQFGTNVNTFLSTPSSANLAAALTDETGTGVNVFNNTPTLIAPILGTPTSGNLSNCTNAVGYSLKSATTTIDVSAATAPTAGQVLTATSGTAATWQSAGVSPPAYGAIGSYTIAAVVSSGTVYVGGDTVAGSALCIIGSGNTSNYFGLGQNNSSNALVILATTNAATLGLSGTWRLMEFKSGWSTTFASASVIGFWMRIA